MAAIEWSDGAPIYRQLKDRVVAMLLDGILKPGDALPSVRQVAAEYQLNPITVSRAYQELADEAIVEKRRGLGMYVTEGASEKLLTSERERFKAPVSGTMASDLQTLAPSASMQQLRDILDRGLTAVIADGDHFYGLITRFDLLNHLRRTLT